MSYIVLEMKRIFVQTPLFSKKLDGRGGDLLLRAIEEELLKDPDAGDLIQAAGGVRKLRIADPGRGKGKRGGFRVIHLNIVRRQHSLLITFYGKDEADDLTANDKRVIRELVKRALAP
jgi:hypothetical protein